MKHILNLVFLVDAVKNYPEFMGYEGKPFPGQPSPWQPQILPRDQPSVMSKGRRSNNATALIRLNTILTFRPDSFLPWLEEGETMDGGLFTDSDASSLELENTNSTDDSYPPWLEEEEEAMDAFDWIYSPEDPDTLEDADIKDIIGLGLNSRYIDNELVPVEI